MIEIDNKVSQVVYFPKTMKSTGPYTLKIHSELSQKDWYIDNLLDQANLNDYYKFTVDFSNVDDGEFNYEIRKADDVFDTGLIRIGVVQNYGDGYNTQVEIIQYDQYSDPQIRYQHKSISALTNGNYYVTPDAGYAALSEVDVHVDVPSQTINNKSLNKIFANNNVDIINRTELGQKKWYVYHAAEQPELPSGYTGFYPVTLSVGVDITSVYDSGYTDGVEAASGGSYQQGYDDGEAAQKAKLVATTITANNTYTRADGWKSVTVNVPQTGHTDQELLNAFNSGYTNGKTEGYNSGYTNGKAEGYNSGWTNGYGSGYTAGYASGYTDGWNDCSGQTPTTAATALTISVPSSITGTGKVNVTAEPSTAILDLVYTSSDTSIATVDSNGNITVLSAGTISITVTDLNSGLFDTQTITVEPATKLNTPLTFNITSGGTIKWTRTTSTGGKTIQYSLNNGEWTSITSNVGAQTPTIPVSAGDKIRFRGDNATYSDTVQYNTFSGTTAKFEVEGNIMSLIDSTGYTTATTLASSYTFTCLFRDCTGLTSAENLVLPATTLADYCYYQMFYGCTSLTTAPALPATTLADYCYIGMFQGCTSLTTAPELPATTLANGCYNSMFYNCSSLTTAPELPASSLTQYGYGNMFRGCTSLNYIKCLATDLFATYCTDGWVKNVAPTGTFVKDASMTGWTTGDNGIPTGWIVEDEPSLVPLTFNIISAGTINWYASNSAETRTIQYKINNGEWTNITSSKNPATISVYAGDKVLFIGDNAYYSSGSSYNNSFCGTTAIFSLEGNIMSLIDSTGYTTATTLQNGYNFSYLFYRCLGLVSAENLVLPATTLAPYCYERMFSFCNGLTVPPELPATTLSEGCYYHMFYNCMALQRAQTSLPATTLANNCYDHMFSSCPVLGQIPAILPATTLAPGCYKFMFGSCWNLNTVPELPATTLAEECYASMFNDCRSLTVVPVLPATNLANYCYAGMLGGTKITTAPTLPATTLADFCYYYMFGNCTGLTSAPALPATTLANNCYDGMFSYCSNLSSAPVLEAPTLVKYCYSGMFQGCTKVNYIKCLATNISATGCTSDWLKNAAVNGTFVKDQNMSDWTRGTSGIPVNWLIEDAQ